MNPALIVGAGEGLSASLARLLTIEGIKVALAARSTEKLKNLANEIGATRAACDASKPRAGRGTLPQLSARLKSLCWIAISCEPA